MGPQKPSFEAQTLYDVLGVEKDATEEEIKKAYKKRSKETHPDVEGGSHEQQVAVVEAYHTLIHPETRLVYDETMNKGGGKSIVDHAINILEMMIQECIDDYMKQGISADDNILWDIKKACVEADKKSNEQIQKLEKKIKVTSIIKSSVKTNDGNDEQQEDDIVTRTFNQRLNKLKSQRDQLKFSLVVSAFLVQQLERYEMHAIEESLVKRYINPAGFVSVKSFLNRI